MYIERLLLQTVHQSPAPRGLSYVIGHKALIDALNGFESTPRYQRLVISFKVGEDPDAAYSRVPYDKGANLLLLLGVLVEDDISSCILTTGPQNGHWEATMSCVHISGTM